MGKQVADQNLKRISFAAVILGASAALGQLLLFREICALSLGNEMSIGLIFAGWLAGVAAGGAAHGLFSRHSTNPASAAPPALILLAASLPASILLARSMRHIAGYGRGESLPFTALCWMIPLVSAIPAALSGFAFSALCSQLRNSDNPAAAPARVYSLDAAGSLAAILAYCMLLVFVAGPMRLSCAAAVLLCAAAYSCAPRTAMISNISLAALAVAAAFLVFFSGPLDLFSRRVQWSGMRVDTIQESPYANLTAVVGEGQTAIYANGRLAGTVPEPVTAAFDAHVPLSLIGNPRDVLVIGGGPSIVREILKHGARRVTIAEIDPVMIALRERYMTPADLILMHGPRVRLEITDARKLVVSGALKFDAIIMRAGDPDTLLVNRYYTLEFLRAVRTHLNPGGVFSMRIQFQENSMSATQADLLGTHVRTLSEAFHRRPLPILAGQGALLIEPGGQPPGALIRRALENYSSRKITSENFGPELLVQALDPDRTAQALQQPEITGPDLSAYFAAPNKTAWALDRLAARPGARTNRDFTPVSVFMQLRAASEQRGAGSAVFKLAEKFAAPAWLAIMIAACLLSAVRGRAGHGGAGGAAATHAAGFASMGVEIAAVFVFQTLNGNIYYFVGLIIAAFMAGGAAGGWAAAKTLRRGAPETRILHISLAALCALCLIASRLIGGALTTGVTSGAGMMCFVFATGALAAAVYSAASAHGGPGRPGVMYASDLTGAAAAALIAGVFVIPSSGVPRAMTLCALTTAIALAAALFQTMLLARGPRR